MKKLIVAVMLAVSWNANALFEVRAGYGVETPGQDSYQNRSVSTISGFNLDGIFEIPMTSWGVGLRYEDLGFDISSNGQEWESDLKRTSILVNYRLLDSFAYFGIIGTLGFMNEMKVNVTGLGQAEYKADFTTSVGVEAGVSLALISLGAELGYMSANLKDDDGGIVNNPDFDASGVYMKAIVGFGF